MIITKMHLSRRFVLRGIGAALALPVLDSMVPASVLVWAPVLFTNSRVPTTVRPSLLRTETRLETNTCIDWSPLVSVYAAPQLAALSLAEPTSVG